MLQQLLAKTLLSGLHSSKRKVGKSLIFAPTHDVRLRTHKSICIIVSHYLSTKCFPAFALMWWPTLRQKRNFSLHVVYRGITRKAERSP